MNEKTPQEAEAEAIQLALLILQARETVITDALERVQSVRSMAAQPGSGRTALQIAEFLWTDKIQPRERPKIAGNKAERLKNLAERAAVILEQKQCSTTTGRVFLTVLVLSNVDESTGEYNKLYSRDITAKMKKFDPAFRKSVTSDLRRHNGIRSVLNEGANYYYLTDHGLNMAEEMINQIEAKKLSR